MKEDDIYSIRIFQHFIETDKNRLLGRNNFRIYEFLYLSMCNLSMLVEEDTRISKYVTLTHGITNFETKLNSNLEFNAWNPRQSSRIKSTTYSCQNFAALMGLAAKFWQEWILLSNPCPSMDFQAYFDDIWTPFCHTYHFWLISEEVSWKNRRITSSQNKQKRAW